ncbi:MAG: hypothetical protein ABI601_01925 [bacterium]
MISTTDLHELSQELADSKVLSVYLDTRLNDHALRFTGRAALAAALRAARTQIDDDAERILFDRAAAAIYRELPSPDDLWGAPGWVAFVTADRVRHVGWLPVRPTSFAAWRDGPVIAPYLRALKQQRAVAVALVDSRSARLYRYVGGTLEAIETVAHSFEELPGGERAALSSRAGRSVPAPRAALATEAAERRRRSAFQRLSSVLSVRLGQLCGPDGWVLIGGTPAWSRIAGEALPPRLRERTLLSPTLGHVATDEEIAREAKRAASRLRAAHGRRLLADVLETAGAHGRAAVGLRSVERALDMHAVELLLLSPAFISSAPLDAEGVVRAALAGGTAVEVLSGDAAEQLDQTAGGIGARLRYALTELSRVAGAPYDVPRETEDKTIALDNATYKDYPTREESDATLLSSIHRDGTFAGST